MEELTLLLDLPLAQRTLRACSELCALKPESRTRGAIVDPLSWSLLFPILLLGKQGRVLGLEGRPPQWSLHLSSVHTGE